MFIYLFLSDVIHIYDCSGHIPYGAGGVGKTLMTFDITPKVATPLKGNVRSPNLSILLKERISLKN